MYLRIVFYVGHSYYVYTITEYALFRTLKGASLAKIPCGMCTNVGKGLWYLFVRGKVIDGTPSDFYVKLTPKEAKLFQMIKKTEFWRKRSFWKKVVEEKRDRIEVLKELEEVLPLYLLNRKLENQRT